VRAARSCAAFGPEWVADRRSSKRGWQPPKNHKQQDDVEVAHQLRTEALLFRATLEGAYKGTGRAAGMREPRPYRRLDQGHGLRTTVECSLVQAARPGPAR
jgi:hypothetical protein